MAQITIRKLDADIVARLRERARGNDRSVEAEVRRILAEALGQPDAAAREQALRFRQKLRGRIKGDSTAIIRAARDA